MSRLPSGVKSKSDSVGSVGTLAGRRWHLIRAGIFADVALLGFMLLQMIRRRLFS
jgi:hypothetical protein